MGRDGFDIWGPRESRYHCASENIGTLNVVKICLGFLPQPVCLGTLKLWTMSWKSQKLVTDNRRTHRTSFNIRTFQVYFHSESASKEAKMITKIFCIFFILYILTFMSPTVHSAAKRNSGSVSKPKPNIGSIGSILRTTKKPNIGSILRTTKKPKTTKPKRKHGDDDDDEENYFGFFGCNRNIFSGDIVAVVYDGADCTVDDWEEPLILK